ncbi:MAG TPA: threonine/serine dehydratase [Devosiaceae bacterium]|nr:threonine/serine dehydratase [Devosiaceae bacterium]
MQSISPPITPASIEAAETLIRPHIRSTPVIEVAASDFGLAGEPVSFKLEFLQVSGTFKARGAFFSLLTRGEPGQVVVAASGGNHGAAVAYAAQRLGRKAHIFVPSISSAAKIEKIRAYGAEVIVGGAGYADALAASEAFIEKCGGLRVHAYDQAETLIGQGTVGLELKRQAPEAETVLVSVGGGGLIGGIAAYYAGAAKVIAVEPERAPSLTRALEAGEPVDVDVSGVAADSLGARRAGVLATGISRRFVAFTVLVTDEEIIAAQKALWDVLRIVAEPGGAAAFAALYSGRYRPRRDERVSVVLCGANTTAVHFD